MHFSSLCQLKFLFQFNFQDKNDDLLIGLKSTSILLGDRTKTWLTGFSCTMVSALTMAGYMGNQTLPYYVAVALIAAHLGVQVRDSEVFVFKLFSLKFMQLLHN